MARLELRAEGKGRWIWLGAIALCGGLAAGGWYYGRGNGTGGVTMAIAQGEPMTTVTALGRLAPVGEVVTLSAPTTNQGNRVEQLFVREGDRLQRGQVVAILDSYPRLKAAVEQAEQQITVAEAQLAVVKAGAKQGEIAAQQAEINRIEAQYRGDIAMQSATVQRLQAQVDNAQVEYERYQSLFDSGAISASQLDSKTLMLDTAKSALQEAQASLQRTRTTTPDLLNRAKATLAQIAEVRPVDIQVAQANLEQAIAVRNQAQTNLDQAVVYAPIAGEVLSIHTRPGEVVASNGIVDIAQTQTMQAIAEVYQSDVSNIRVGQTVRVTSEAIAGDLSGTVERIGSQVLRQSVVNTDPSANIDARVVEVYALLDAASSQKAAKFTNLQVQMEIDQGAQ